MLNLTEEDFDQTINEGVTFVDFYTTWCPPCRMFSPLFEQTAKANPKAKFAKVNLEDAQSLSTRYRISAVPTVLVFKDGKQVHAWTGAPSAKEMGTILESVI